MESIIKHVAHGNFCFWWKEVEVKALYYFIDALSQINASNAAQNCFL